MSPVEVKCPKCQTPLDGGMLNTGELQPCPACRTPVQAEAFPALFRRVAPGQGAELIMLEGEANCFYHPAKRAVRACEGCGRFMCGLCDCELRGQHFCPACLEAGRKKGKIKSLENTRTMYDSIALSLAILPLLLFYITIFTAPLALYYSIRYWNAPRGVTHRTRIRFVFAIIFAVLELIGWVFAFYFIFQARSTNG